MAPFSTLRSIRTPSSILFPDSGRSPISRYTPKPIPSLGMGYGSRATH